MKERIVIVAAFCFCLVLIFALATICTAKDDSENTKMDYSQLHLKVIKVYNVFEAPSLHSGSILIPDEGQQFIVVDLEGTAPRAMDITLKPGDCVIQSSSVKSFSTAVGIKVRIKSAERLAWSNYSINRNSVKESDNVSFSVLFPVDEKIKNFKLSCGGTVVSPGTLKLR